MPHPPGQPNGTPLPSLLAGLCGACAGAYMLTTLPTTAPTFDEVAHLGAGVARALSGVQQLNLEHPPLVKWLAALPLLPFLQVPSEALWPENQWALGREVLTGWGLEGQEAITLGRLPMVGFCALLGVSIYQLCAEAWGAREALLSLLLVSFCPIFLGHGRLVTTDVPLAALAVMCAWLAWRSVERPSLPTAAMLGAGLGALLATKYTGIVLVPGILGTVVWQRWRQRTGMQRAWKETLTAAACGMGVLQSAYGAQPFWTAWEEGFMQVGFNHVPGYAFYRGGVFSHTGFWDYFGYALSVKVGWGVLLLVLLGPLAWMAGRRRDRPGADVESPPGDPRSDVVPVWPFLVMPAGSYSVAVQLLAPEIGVRYLIPALPFLYMGLARAGVWLSRQGKPGRTLVWAAVLAQLASAGAAWPDPISFMNGVGGCYGTRASACLDDSNLDWGQDLARVGPELVRKGILESPAEPVRLLYFGTVEPREWLSGAERVTPDELIEPLPAVYVLSIQRLLRNRLQAGAREDQDWLRRFTPVAWIGNTYAVFDFRVKIGRNKRHPKGMAVETQKQGAPS